MTKTISGALFRKMIISGGAFLEENKEYVDSLNVYPVPDGDTGTNMTLTMKSAIKEVNMCTNNNIDELAEAVSKGALKGARGNSGVILSQILKGFCTSIASEKNITTKSFAKALHDGSDMAYKAVTVPKEGTILTVIRVMSEDSVVIAKSTQDFEEFLKLTLEKGEEILKQTPEMLPVLKKAGVVDAGGRGLLVILNGFLKVIMGDETSLKIEFDKDKVGDNDLNFAPANLDYTDISDIEFAYCTEFFITNMNKKTTEADIDRLREKLMSIGNSVICIGDLKCVKVHVHTNDPGVALSSALKLGELDNLKIENMLEQFRARKLQSAPEELKPIGMVSICAGSGLADIFKDLMVDYVIEGGQTMNPSAEDIAMACDKVPAETVFVFPNNKNIILAAELAKDLSKRNVIVIPTISVPQGISAALAINFDDTVENNESNMKEALGNVITGSVTYAVRSTVIDGLKLKEGDIIGLDSKNIITKGETIAEVTTDLIEKLKNDDIMNVTLFYGSDVSPEDAESLKNNLAMRYPDIDVDVHSGGQPLYYYLISLE